MAPAIWVSGTGCYLYKQERRKYLGLALYKQEEESGLAALIQEEKKLDWYLGVLACYIRRERWVG